MLGRGFLTPRPASALFALAAVVLATPRTTSAQSQPWEWSNVPRIVAMGDVHGRFAELLLVLQAAELVDGERAWSGGKAHLVLCGDLIDRGQQDRAVLDLVRRLQTEAETAGGRVHALLGNHEAMNMIRDLRYVSIYHGRKTHLRCEVRSIQSPEHLIPRRPDPCYSPVQSCMFANAARYFLYYP